MAKLTTEAFIRKAKKKHGEFYDYSRAVYDGAHTLLEIVCPLHGSFMQRAGDHANVGKGCKQCGAVRATPTPFSTADFVRQSAETHADFYSYEKSVYSTYKLPLTITCPTHGDFSQRAGQHMRGNGCPLCRRGRKSSKFKGQTRQQRFESWLERADKLHSGFYSYARVVFVNTKTPVTIVCPAHGEFSQTPGNHVDGPCGCPQCASKSKSDLRTKSHAGWIAGFLDAHGESAYDYTVCEDIAAATQRVSIGCHSHGVFRQQAYVHQQGLGCPKCSGKESTPEVEMREWLAATLPPGEELQMNTRSVIPPFELDVYLPGLKVALEFNGTYWHCDERKARLYHQKKSLACRSLGIQLIHVYEHDWDSRPEACKQMIAGKLSLGCQSLNARSLSLREVGNDAGFLRANHFQGSVAASVGYGLFDADRMVALMTFGKSRFNDAHTWEMLRFCSLRGCRVRGAASRLFAAFRRGHLALGESVVSYARLDYSSGNVYQALGFVEEAVCAPDYVWVKQPGVVLGRQATQKHKLGKLLGKRFDADKSEAENMKSCNYKRVYSAGNLRYVYRHE